MDIEWFTSLLQHVIYLVLCGIDDNGDIKKYCELQKIEGSDLAGNSLTKCGDHGVCLLHFGLPKVRFLFCLHDPGSL